MKRFGAALLSIFAFCGILKAEEYETTPVKTVLVYNEATGKVDLWENDKVRILLFGEQLIIFIHDEEDDPPDEPGPNETPLQKKVRELAEQVNDNEREKTAKAISLLYRSTASLGGEEEGKVNDPEDLKKGLNFLYKMTLEQLKKTDQWKEWKEQVDQEIGEAGLYSLSEYVNVLLDVAKGLEGVK